MVAFIIWCAVACLFIIIGISCLFAKKATGFWANAETVKIKNIRGYNRAMAKLWCTFGVVMGLLGIPLLNEAKKTPILLSTFGVVAEIIVIMVVYEVVIVPRYREQ